MRHERDCITVVVRNVEATILLHLRFVADVTACSDLDTVGMRIVAWAQAASGESLGHR